MIITKKWAMPNSKTFTILPIKELIIKYLQENGIVLDPFANEMSIKNVIKSKYISNDLDSSYQCDYSMDALEFFKMFDNNSIDLILFDPPYSPRQVKECYTELELTVTIEQTGAQYWSNLKNEIQRILKIGGKVISFGWNTNGIGINRGFQIEEILIVAHGGSKNDTLCTVETKLFYQDNLFELGEEDGIREKNKNRIISRPF